MARSYAHIYLTIWNDPDFRGLPADAQWLYFVMLTHPTLTSCGVIEWREARLTNMAGGVTVERLRHAAWELAQRRLIAVDVETEEALVRSFVRHDGVLKSPNITKSMVREHASIASLRIMELVSREVRRAIEEEPDMKGSEFANPVAKQFPEEFPKGFEWVPEWFEHGSENGHLENGEPFQISSAVPTPYPLPPSANTEGVQGETDALVPASVAPAAAASSARMKIEEDFANWYEVYPRKRGKADALKAYRAARKAKVTHQTLVDALAAQLAEFAQRKPEHIPYPATWIRDGSWEDELTTPDAKPAAVDPMLDENGRYRDIPAHPTNPERWEDETA